MIKTINLHDFRQAFQDHGRGEQFSYEALGLIFEYYEQYEDDTGEQVNLDVIAICCDLAELSVEEIVRGYILDQDEEYLAEEWSVQDVKHFLCDQAAYVGETDQTVIFVQF